MPTLMVDIVQHVVAAESDMAVVGVADDGDVPAAIRRTRADVVVIGQDREGERDFFMRLLRGHPHIKVLTISSGGTRGAFYELRPRRIPLGKISAKTLAAAIRTRTPLNIARAATPTIRIKSAEVH
jgi:DNA-binding NarL/FixJ family response regulator